MTRHRRKRTSRAWTIAAMMALVVGGVIFASRQATRTVTIPQLSPSAQAGQQAFGRNCAWCHGERGQGTLSGPPLVHSTYRSEDHSDAAFERAVRLGVRAHHWNRGHMPPQPAVASTEVDAITRYIRELQEANGIR